MGGNLGSELGRLVLVARFVPYESGGTFVAYACCRVFCRYGRCLPTMSLGNFPLCAFGTAFCTLSTSRTLESLCTLGFSFRASSIRVTIRITNKCDFLYYVFISFFSSFPYMFRAFMSPSSGVFQAVVFMLPFGSCSALLVVCMSQRTGLWW